MGPAGVCGVEGMRLKSSGAPGVIGVNILAEEVVSGSGITPETEESVKIRAGTNGPGEYCNSSELRRPRSRA